MSPQSQTPSQTNGHHNELRGVRTYRGRKLEDLIPQIREELGPDAIILRQREGLTGGVGGFFAQKCVEVDAQAPQPLVDIYDEHDVDQSLLDEIEDPYADPVPEVTLELPALESGEIAYEPIEPTEAVRPETPNLIETFYVPTGGIDGAIDELPDEFAEFDEPMAPELNGYERHAAELPVIPAQPDEPVGPSFVERLQEAAGLIADVPAPVAPQPAPVAAEPAPVAVEPQPEPVVLARPVLAPEPAPVVIEPEPSIAPEPAPVAIEPQPFIAPEPAPVAVEPAPAPVAFELEPAPVAVEPEPAAVAIEPEPAAVVIEPEPIAIPQPATAAARAVAPQPIIRPKPIITQQAPAPVQVPAQRAFAAQQAGQIDGDDAAALADELISQGISERWAQQLIDEAAAHRSPLAAGNLRDAVRATLASTLPSSTSLPAGGAAIAFVGAGGSGKTRCTASLAAAYARSSTLAASVVALGGEDWGAEVKDLLKGQSTWVTVAPTAHDASAAVQSGRQNGMVVVDTPATSPRDEAAIQALAVELSSLELDALYITIPATFSVHAAKRLVESFVALGVDGIAVTHADEAEQLGVAAELAHISGVPIAYVHDGLVLDSALSASDPTSLAARLLP
jgi:flagellar biosynthesis GTPase FlhF